jgi:hypothetical protein
MCFSDGVRVEFVAKLDAHVCELTKVLGDPKVQSRGDKLFTSWVFEYPQGQRHWLVCHESELPVLKDGGCGQHELLTWDIYGETEDLEVIQDLGSYLISGRDFYVDAD